jgi:hypothetical protein
MKLHSLLLLPSLLIYGICIGTADAAFASRCKDVNIKIHNNSSSSIIVTKFEYFDFDKNKFRTEILHELIAVIGAVPALVASGSANIAIPIDPGKFVGGKENLSYVGNQKTLFKVTYKKQIAGTSDFGSSISKQSESFTCRDDSSHSVSLD